MKIDFTGKGFNITDRVREFTESKMERWRKHLDDVHDVTVVLSVEKYRHRAEIKFSSQKKVFHGSEETTDMFQSIDRVVEKLDVQASKYRQKMTGKKKHTHDTIRAAVDPEPNHQTAPGIIEDSAVQVIPADVSKIKPMGLEEAVEELTKFNQEIIFFRNAETENLNVVYRRKDGHIGHIDPSP